VNCIKPVNISVIKAGLFRIGRALHQIMYLPTGMRLFQVDLDIASFPNFLVLVAVKANAHEMIAR
jgi:hypothetical protein